MKPLPHESVLQNVKPWHGSDLQHAVIITHLFHHNCRVEIEELNV